MSQKVLLVCKIIIIEQKIIKKTYFRIFEGKFESDKNYLKELFEITFIFIQVTIEVSVRNNENK